MSYKAMAESFRQQVEDQKAQVENLKTALLKLQQKLVEAESKSDMLIAQHRRSRALGKATEAGTAMGDESNARGLRPHEEQGAAQRSDRAGARPIWSPTMWTTASPRWRRKARSTGCWPRSSPSAERKDGGTGRASGYGRASLASTG